ncbi:ATP-binding protein [Streptomyces sp. DSM 15324]|uniref:ATP-binding protein n=1 Tax=Streptomyces sp. DSM 15324 TaxID=1739111 RepID=UPI002D218683|nr:ATP-binding protein [Streptomyces sp. DSM 15324]
MPVTRLERDSPADAPSASVGDRRDALTEGWTPARAPTATVARAGTETLLLRHIIEVDVRGVLDHVAAVHRTAAEGSGVTDRSRNSGTGGSGLGLGLGLAIARKRTEAHAGTLTATSAPAHGTVVTVRLPRQRHGSSTRSVPAARASGPRTARPGEPRSAGGVPWTGR